MAKLLASSQITIVDLNDAVSLRSYIQCSHARVQFLNNNSSYVPDYATENVVLTAQLNVLGNNTDIIKNPGTVLSRVDWYVKIAPSQEYVKITPAMTEYELVGTSPFFSGLKIKRNIMNESNPGATFKVEMDYKEPWMEDVHTQISEVDFSLTVQGNDGADAYTAILTNSNHTVICNADGSADDGEIGISGRATSGTVAYKGTKLLTAVASNPTVGQYSISLVNEQCTAVKKGNDSFYINTLTESNSAKVKVSFNLEGTTTIVQEMTISKVFNGADGNDGEAAKYVTLSIKEGSSIFKYEKGQTTPNISRTVLEALVFNITGATYKWYYYGNNSWNIINSQTASTLIVNATDSYFNISNSITFRCMVNDTFHDEITISKLIDGNDSILVQLSNESHVIGCYNGGGFKPGESDRAVTEVTAYKGSQPLTLVTTTPSAGQYKIDLVANAALETSVTGNSVKILNMTADSAVLVINVNCEGTVYKKTMSLSKAKDGKEGIDGFIATLTNEYHSLPANSSGTVTSYNGCSTSIELYKGDSIVTQGVTYTAVASSGITGSLTGNTYTVTGLTVDTSTVVLTAQYNGKSYSKTFTVAKNKQGEDGHDSTSYWLIPSATSINKDKTGVLSPTSITYTAKKQTGTNPLEDYSGIFKIYTSTNKGQTYSVAYTSSAAEASKTYTIPNTTTAIKCELYLANGSTLVDTQTIIVTTDGADGLDGKDAAYVIVSGETAFKYGPNFIGTPTPSSILLTRNLFNAVGGKWQYHDGTSWVDFSPAQTGATLEVTPTMAHFALSSNKIMRVRYAVNDNVYDETSIIKIADGAAGANAYTVVLDNESHTVAADTNGALLSGEAAKATTGVLVYKGTDVVNSFTLAKVSDEGIVTNVDTTNKTITLTSMPNSSMSGKCTVKITVEGQNIQKVFSITKSKQAADGANAKLVSLTASSQTFITGKTGTVTPDSITLTATTQGLSGNVSWTKSVNGGTFVAVTETVNGNTLTVAKTNVTAGSTVTYKATLDGYTDTISVSHLKDGIDGSTAYTVVMTNESHTLVAENDGTVTATELDKTETQILVYQGTSAITNFTLATESPVGCTVSSPTSDKKLKLTAMSADTASYTAVITVGGQTLKKVFNAVKSKKALNGSNGADGADAKVVSVSGEQVFKYPSGSSTPTNTSIVLTRVMQGVTGGKWQHFNTAWTDFSTAQTGETVTITHNMAGTLFAGSANSMRVRYIAGDNATFDEITLSKLKDGNAGTDAYTVVLSNPSHTVNADSSGVVSNLATATTDIIAYKGTAAVVPTVSNKVVVPSTAEFTITQGSSSSNAKITMTSFPSDADMATCTVDVVVGGQTLKQTFTVTKAKQGVQGNAAKAVFVSGKQIFKYEKSSSIPTETSITLTAVERNFTGTTRKWYQDGTLISGQTSTNLVVNHNDSYWGTKTAITFKYEADGIYDEITVSKLYDGNDTYSVILSNESHSVSCDKNGTATSTEIQKALTLVKVFKGTTALTASNTPGAGNFVISLGTQTGGTATLVSNGTANDSVRLATITADSGTIIINVNADNGVNMQKTFSFNKTKVGADGAAAKVIQISGPNSIVYKKDGTYDPADGIALTIQKKNVTGTIVWKINGTQKATGDTYTVPVSEFASAKNITVRAEVSGDTAVYDLHTISKVTDGVDSVTAYVWCPNGSTIRNDNVSSLNVEAVIFSGSSNVSATAGAKYHWQKKVGADWVDIKGTSSAPIAGDAGGNSITINQDDIPYMLIVRCTMTYGSASIIDTAVLEDINDPVHSTIFSTAGTTFKNGVGETHLVAKVIRNGNEMDSIRLVENIPSVAGVQGEIVYVKSSNKYYKYNNTAWGEIATPSTGDNSTYTYTWTKTDSNGNLVSGWSKKGKVIYVSSEEISQKAIFMVDVEG